MRGTGGPGGGGGRVKEQYSLFHSRRMTKGL